VKITLESTTKVVDLEIRNTGCMMPARVWEGTTEDGVPCFAFIVRISPAIPLPELTPAQCAEFERDLKEQRAPSAAVASFPLRMVL
jgi:hypothetical protein